MGHGLKHALCMRDESGILHCCYAKKVIFNLEGLSTAMSTFFSYFSVFLTVTVRK